MINEHKKGFKAKKYPEKTKPAAVGERNPVAKNSKMAGKSGTHKNPKDAVAQPRKAKHKKAEMMETVISVIGEAGHPLGKAKQNFEMKNDTPQKLAQYFQGLANQKGKSVEELARSKAWSYGYGKMSDHYWSQIADLIDTSPSWGVDKPTDESGDMMSFFKDLQKTDPKFKNLRVHGDPEHDELRRQDQEKRDAERASANQRSQDAIAQDAANLPELEAEYEKMLARYKSLGGSGWQYADREQNLTSAEREARGMEHGLRNLHSRIAAAKKQNIAEAWSQKYKKSINCSHPKGFSQKAHCAGKKKHNESHEVMEMVCPECGMCETHGNLNEIKKGQKDSNGFTRCWPGKHAKGTKKGKNGGWVRKCVPNEGVAEGSTQEYTAKVIDSKNKSYTVKVSAPSEEGAKHMAVVKVRKEYGVKPEAVIIMNQGVAEATGDERFDTMMGRMQKEPQIPDPQMPPTDVKDLYQWAVKNNKPYHKTFATWANREGFKSVAQALQKAGDLDSDALDYWTPMAWKAWHGDDSEMPQAWSKERIPDELRDYLETVFDAYDNIVFDWPTEYRQIGQQGVAEGEEKRCMQCGMKNCKCPGDSCKCKPIKGWIPGKGFKEAMDEASAAQIRGAIAISKKKSGKYNKDGKRIKESIMNEDIMGLGDDEFEPKQHHDPEGQMARSELYRNAKYAMDLLKMIEPNDDIEPWVAANLTNAATWLDKVYHYLDYRTKFEPAADGPEKDDKDIKESEAEPSGDIARMNLQEIVEYSMKLFKMIKPETRLDGWVAMKLTKASEAVSSSKHYLEHQYFEKHSSDMYESKILKKFARVLSKNENQ